MIVFVFAFVHARLQLRGGWRFYVRDAVSETTGYTFADLFIRVVHVHSNFVHLCTAGANGSGDETFWAWHLITPY
jgi:hypothetical protein